MANIVTFGFLILASHLTTANAIQCLSCDDVAEARDCSRLVTCGAHEICYVQRFLGTNLRQYYKLGCTDKNVCLREQASMLGKRDITSRYSPQVESRAIQSHDRKSRETDEDMVLCLQCCESADGCNKDLCGSPPSTSRRCLTCKDKMDAKDCEQIQECGRDDMCYVHKGINRNIANFQIRHEMGCMGALQCKALTVITPQSCWVCCNQTDLCNYAACDTWTAMVSPTHHAFTTNPPTTTSTTQSVPTTPPPKILVQGPNKKNYMDPAQLTCITEPPAQSYHWKFNSTNILPNGITTQQVSMTAGSVAGVDQLVIANLTEAQAGTYTCVAIINGHHFRKSHHLGINGEKPTVHITKTQVINNIAMQCTVTGYPIPTIVWDLIPASTGGHGIPSGVEFSDKPLESTMFVKTYIPADHNGLWTCKASNPLGNALDQVHVP